MAADQHQAHLPIFRVGCAGWALSSRVSASFPGGDSHLERYARVFSCVEINSSFYRPHQEKTYRRWASSVPESFRFSVKVPRSMTHERRLKACEGLMDAFLAQVAGLGKKLGCLLIQLPPSLALSARQAMDFFSRMRARTEVPIVCEPRHRSWFTADGRLLLSDLGVGMVWAHPEPVSGIADLVDEPLLYLRLHGAPEIYVSAYDDAFIEAMASQMQRAQMEGRAPWCIFDNTARGEAIPNALHLMERLGIR